MGILTQYLKPTVAAALSAIAFLQPSVALSADLDALMLQLRDADPRDAARLADEIQLEWSKSGSATADYLLKRGRDAMERGDTTAALEHLTALVDHAPDFAEGWVTRAGVYFHAGLLGPAVHDLEQALALNPQHFEAIIGLATLFEMIDRPDEAYEAYLQVKAIHPAHPDVTEALQRLAPLVKGQTL
ncbi:tetratricopeptide repeat protein [Shimia sp. SDUM112013]|uniref:tetratricopeptide repeat protein n=1 Tax=Shimia sp. SDUM112013 TaxID=3136160 RepID=UPI0032F0547E